MEKKEKKITPKKSAKKSKKKNTKTSKKKGFTLIELLAVIIILGILMIIAIPSVTSYINSSRKSAYVDTAKEIVSGTRNIVNTGKLGMYDTKTTYYIPASYISTENGLKSPYGEFTQAYVGVVYDGKGYKYYWISTDDTGQGIDRIILSDKLVEDDIVSDLKDSDIEDKVKTTGIGGRNKILILDENGHWGSPYSAGHFVGEYGELNKIKTIEELFDRLANCVTSQDGYEFISLLPPFLPMFVEDIDISIQLSSLENAMKQANDTYIQEYGSDYKIKYIIENSSVMSDEEVENLEFFVYRMTGSEVKITKVYNVSASMNIKGSLKETTEPYNRGLVIEYDNSLYMFPNYY